MNQLEQRARDDPRNHGTAYLIEREKQLSNGLDVVDPVVPTFRGSGSFCFE